MHRLTRFVLLSTLAMIVAVPAFALVPSTSDDDVAVRAGRRLIHAHLRVLGVPGMQVAVARGDRMLWSEGFGFADLETRSPVTPETTFPIASVSKTLTATAVAALVESGDMELDAPVRRYVPSFPEKRWPITIRQLAGHLAGVRHYRGEEIDTLGGRNYPDVSSSLEIFAGDSLLFRPGAEYHYSSYGYNLLSAAVRSAAGRPFVEYVQDRILERAGMRHTSPWFLDSLISNRVSTYVEGSDGGRINAPAVDMSYKWGSGGYASTAEDLVLFGRALLDGELVRPETVRRMWTSQRTDAGETTGYGIGWEILTLSDGGKVVYHGGNLPDARAHLLIVPAERLVFAVLANTGQNIAFNDEELLALVELFAGPEESPTVDPSGRYLFRTEWQESTVTGWLEIHGQNGEYTGTISFPFRATPIPAVDVRGGSVHLIAVPGSWMHLWLDFNSGEITGRWAWGPLEEPLRDIRRVDDGSQ